MWLGHLKKIRPGLSSDLETRRTTCLHWQHSHLIRDNVSQGYELVATEKDDWELEAMAAGHIMERDRKKEMRGKKM